MPHKPPHDLPHTPPAEDDDLQPDDACLGASQANVQAGEAALGEDFPPIAPLLESRVNQRLLDEQLLPSRGMMIGFLLASALWLGLFVCVLLAVWLSRL